MTITSPYWAGVAKLCEVDERAVDVDDRVWQAVIEGVVVISFWLRRLVAAEQLVVVVFSALVNLVGSSFETLPDLFFLLLGNGSDLFPLTVQLL